MDQEIRDRLGGLEFVLISFAASRFFYLVAGTSFAAAIPVSGFYRVTDDVPFGTMNIWAHWDGEHYAMLAANGYLNPPANVSPAFFPLYPLLIRSFAELFGGPIVPGTLGLWGVLISLLSLPFALYFVYRIAEDGWGTRTARATVLLLAYFPTAFFLNAAYTESLFLALSAGSLWAARVRKDLLLACLLAGLATATRNVGVFLLVPLACAWFVDRERYGWRVVYLSLAPSGLVAYAAYLWWRFGNPLLFYAEQRDWNRQPTGPLAIVRGAWKGTLEGAKGFLDPQLRADPSLGALVDAFGRAQTIFNLAFLVLALLLVVVGLRLISLDLGAYAFLLVVPPAFFGTPQDPLMGLPRYVLVAFPIFIVLAILLKDRRLFGGWLVLSAAFSLVLCALFVTWRFVA